MRLIRVSIAGLMGLVLLSAVGFTALRSGSELWFSALYTLAVGVLLVATIAARLSRRDAGTFWFGFALVGWTLLLLGFGLKPLPSDELRTDQLDGLLNEYLFTTKVLKSIDSAVVVPDDVTQIGKYGNRLIIGHTLLTLVLAFAGGLFALALRGFLVRRSRTRLSRGPVARLRRPVRSAALVAASSGLVLLALIGVFWQLHRSQGPYFPNPTAGPTQGLSADEAKSYSKHLAAMGEPSLWKLSQADRAAVVYRLLWIPQSENPIAVRVTKSGETVTLQTIVLDGQGDLDPGAIGASRTVTLDRAQWEKVMRHAEEAGFWSLPTQDEKSNEASGDSLIVEGVQEGRHHVVERTRGVSGTYDAFCRAMLDASGLSYQPAWGGFR